MLTRLRLCDFRPFPLLDFEPSSGKNFIVGDNARGKTSIIEAVCLLLRLQSPRTSAPRECVRFGTAGFGLDGSWGDTNLRVTFDEGGTRKFLLDGNSASLRDYLAVGKVTWMDNADSNLIIGSSSARRRYLDFLGTQIMPSYGTHLRAYDRALRSRNALLREGRPWDEVAAFHSPLITAGEALRDARKTLVVALAPLVQTAYTDIAKSNECATTTYRPACESSLADLLENNRQRDTAAGLTTAGPHRDELEISLDGHAASAFASEGQRRSLAIALKLAQATHIHNQTGISPILLIDDVFGELDTTRRENFLAALPSNAQILITVTSLAWHGTDDARIFHLEKNGDYSPSARKMSNHIACAK